MKRKAIFLISSIALSGCFFDMSIINDDPINKLVSDSMREALRAVADTVHVDMPQLPERQFNPYKGGSYTDPLAVPPIFNITDLGKVSPLSITYKLDADPSRPKGYIPEKLEQYPLSSFRMVGVITRLDGKFSALLIRDGEKQGTVITVNEGDYIGKNFGRIVQIAEASIKVSEKVAISQDQDWNEHITYIDLTIRK